MTKLKGLLTGCSGVAGGACERVKGDETDGFGVKQNIKSRITDSFDDFSEPEAPS